MIKIDLDSHLRDEIAELHWQWLKGTLKPTDLQQIYRILKFKSEDELRKLITADLEKLKGYTSKWTNLQKIPTLTDKKNIKDLQSKIKELKKIKKTSQKQSQELKKAKLNLQQYNDFFDREILFKLLGYAKFRDGFYKKLEKEIERKKDQISIDEYNRNVKKDWWAYNYCKKLNLTVCPYCNREYIQTIYPEYIKIQGNVKKVKGSRPDLDHFFPESIYPFLSCSIFNLIPACKFCNQVKNDNSDQDMIYPFEEEFGEHGQIHLDLKDNEKIEDIDTNANIQIKFYVGKETASCSDSTFVGRRKLNKDALINNSISTFLLDKLYPEHQDELKDFIIKLKSIRGTQVNTYKEFSDFISKIQGKSLTRQEKRYLLGFPIGAKEYPLRKMKEDIFEQVEGIEQT